MTERIRINRVELGETQSGKAVAHLYAPGAQYAKYPALTLFNPGLLVSVGIDPNTLTEGEPLHCNIWAHYEASEKLNSRGNPYKNVVSLERVDAPATTTSTDTSAILAELRAIKALVLALATGPSTELRTSSQPPAATDPAHATRIHAIMQAGRTGSPADPITTEPIATEPEPEQLSEAEARTAFYELAGPAVTEGADINAVNDLAKSANGDGWNGALAGLRELLAT